MAGTVINDRFQAQFGFESPKYTVDTAGKITKFSADGVITDSIISESGTTVTIANDLVLSGLTASQLVVTNGSKQLVSSTDISSLTLTLDGGEF